MLKYRPNVAAILIDKKEKILIGERINVKGAWQFPQGGIDKGESPRKALKRELEEELSIKPKFYQIKEERSGYRYDFGPQSRRFGKFQGQEQTYFLCQIQEDAKSQISVLTKEQEFAQVRWIYPAKFQLNWLPDFKQETYAQVFQDFFNITL